MISGLDIPCNIDEIYYVSRVLYANKHNEFIPEGVAKYFVAKINISEYNSEEIILKHLESEHELHISSFDKFKHELGKTIFRTEDELIRALKEFVATL